MKGAKVVGGADRVSVVTVGGVIQMTPPTARRLAAELLAAADVAEGRLPAHIYQVDNRPSPDRLTTPDADGNLST